MKVRGAAFLVVLLVNLILPTWARACSCVWGGPFSKVALTKELIVLGVIVDHYKNSMEVRIIEVLKGTEMHKTIRVRGDDGALCRPYVSRFPPGTRWLLALFSSPEKTSEEPPGLWERFFSRSRNREYGISICGDFWLEVRGKRAIGRITIPDYSRSLEWVPLEDVIAWLRSNGQGVTLSPRPASASDR